MDRSTVGRALRILAERDRITPTSERKYEVHVRASRVQPIPVLRDIDTGPGADVLANGRIRPPHPL